MSHSNSSQGKNLWRTFDCHVSNWKHIEHIRRYNKILLLASNPNTLKPEKNGRHFVDDITKCNSWINSFENNVVDIWFKRMQCGANITRSIFSKIFTKDIPQFARYGVSVVDSNSDLYSASDIVIMCTIPCYTGPRYNGTDCNWQHNQHRLWFRLVAVTCTNVDQDPWFHMASHVLNEYNIWPQINHVDADRHCVDIIVPKSTDSWECSIQLYCYDTDFNRIYPAAMYIMVASHIHVNGSTFGKLFRKQTTNFGCAVGQRLSLHRLLR